MEWGQVANGHKLELLFCLVGLALLAWTAVGAQAQEADPTRSFSSTTKGPGSSLVHIGQERCRNRALPRINSRFLKRHLPDASFRIFPATTKGAAGKPKSWHEPALQNIRHTDRIPPAKNQTGRRTKRRSRASPARTAALASMLS